MAALEERPQSQPLLQSRPQSRTSRLLQKVTNFTGRIRVPIHKPNDNRNNHHNPYASQTHTIGGFDAGVKPYMSHPMLGLTNMIVEPFNATDCDGDESCAHSTCPSPTRSEFRRPNRAPPPPVSGYQQTLPRKPISIDISQDGSRAGAVITARRPSLEGLRHTSDSQPRPPNHRRPSTAAGVLESPMIPKKTQEIANSASNTQRRPMELNGGRTKSDESVTGISPARALIRKLSRPRLKDNSDKPSSQTEPLPPSLPVPTVLPVPRPIQTSHSSPLPDIPPLVPPKSQPRRDTAPRLVLPPPNHRFSLTMIDGSPARLSPSIILRPPPLPIMRLPALPIIVAPPESSSGSETAGLRSMPELPHQGIGQRDDGDDDDIHGDGDEDDEVDEVGEGSNLRDTTGSSMSNYDDERPGTSSSTYSNGFLSPSLSSTKKSHSRSSSYHVPLPQVDTSRLDLSFLDRPPPSPPDAKGKGKARFWEREFDESDATRTPTSAAPHDYFSSKKRGLDKEMERDKARLRKSSISSVQTPRASNNLMLLPPARTPSLTLGASLSRPRMYTQVSTSLIDIHAAEKKEKVEQMVRAEEEIKEERRKSIIVKGTKRETIIIGSGSNDKEGLLSIEGIDEASSTERKLRNRISQAPAYDSIPDLRRRRSMPTFTETSTPPPYPSFAPFSHPMSSSVVIQPREDEGRERLPAYSNDIYVKTILPRKMEFTAPGVQARDRKWRRVMCVLEGTVLKIYRCPAKTSGVSAISQWWEGKVGVGDVAAQAGSYTTTTPTYNPETQSPAITESVPKLGEDNNVTVLHIPPAPSPAPSTSPTRTQPQLPTHHPTATRSRLNLAVHLLKPSSRPHSRTNSDVSVSQPIPRSPRPSLNVPRPAFYGNGNLDSNLRTIPANSYYGSTLTLNANGAEDNVNISIPSSASFQQFNSERSASNTSSSPHSPLRNNHEDIPDPDPADLIREYTMQNAESGVGNDYVKRKNVIRVRVEGEQFLLQAKDVACVVEWIEALQAAANIALDLDERVMPKGPLFPRRRRRRGARRPVTDTVGTTRVSEDLPSTTISTGPSAGATN